MSRGYCYIYAHICLVYIFICHSFSFVLWLMSLCLLTKHQGNDGVSRTNCIFFTLNQLFIEGTALCNCYAHPANDVMPLKTRGWKREEREQKIASGRDPRMIGGDTRQRIFFPFLPLRWKGQKVATEARLLWRANNILCYILCVLFQAFNITARM